VVGILGRMEVWLGTAPPGAIALPVVLGDIPGIFWLPGAIAGISGKSKSTGGSIGYPLGMFTVSGIAPNLLGVVSVLGVILVLGVVAVLLPVLATVSPLLLLRTRLQAIKKLDTEISTR
jgi:hypothetical protein